MGKPLPQAQKEVDTLADRARTLAALAPEALAEIDLPPRAGFARSVAREPVGVVVDIAPWNYPLLTAVNAVAAAVLAGNGVIEHSSRTPLCGSRFERAFGKAGAPPGLVRSLTLSHADCGTLFQRPEVGYVAFTGSVAGGREIPAAAIGALRGNRDGARRKRCRLRRRGRRLRPRRRQPGGRCLLQCRPELLRHQEDLRSRAALRPIPGGAGGQGQRLSPRRSRGSGDDDGASRDGGRAWTAGRTGRGGQAVGRPHPLRRTDHAGRRPRPVLRADRRGRSRARDGGDGGGELWSAGRAGASSRRRRGRGANQRQPLWIDRRHLEL